MIEHGDCLDAVPRGTYGAILADPPWRFATWSERGNGRAAVKHYDVMATADIGSLPVGDLAAPDSVLFMWAINPMLPQAFRMIEAWGFTYKTVAFTWAKRTPTGTKWHVGLGYWTRQNTECCLLATRGKPKRVSRAVRQLVEAPRGAHSAKPPEIHARIEALVAGPYLELFARRTTPGWDAFGNEIGGFVSRETSPGGDETC